MDEEACDGRVARVWREKYRDILADFFAPRFRPGKPIGFNSPWMGALEIPGTFGAKFALIV
jgi:hypothetical protein